jgi:hypothetical protein
MGWITHQEYEDKKSQIAAKERERRHTLESLIAERNARDAKIQPYRTALLGTNLLSFSVTDGEGVDRKRVRIEAEWESYKLLEPTLLLYKSAKAPYGSPDEVLAASHDVKLLARVPLGQVLQFVDPDVSENTVYYYYVWINCIGTETGERVNIQFAHTHHTVTYATDAKPTPTLSLTEKVTARLQATMNQHKSARDAIAALEHGLAQVEGTLSARELAVIRAQMMQFIHSEFKQ